MQLISEVLWHGARVTALARSISAVATACLLFACRGSGPSTAKPTPSTSVKSGPTSAPSANASASKAATLTSSSTAAAPTSSSPPPPTSASAARSAGSGPALLDEPSEVGPAGPAAASEHGVVLIDRHDTVFVARPRAPAASARAGKTSISPIAQEAAEFAPYARAPAVVRDKAYWISDGRLVRRALAGGPLEVLAVDARKRTRVVGVPTATGAAVAYITNPDASGAPHGKLWIEGEKSLDLTPDGAGTSSIALAPLGNEILIAALDGRSGMTPLHARSLSFAGKEAKLGADVVSWVGASAQATTEVFATSLAGQTWAFVPIEADTTHFGLMQLELGSAPRLDAPAHFLPYANGTNSAPVATLSLCNRPMVAYAAPESAEPKASAKLVLAELTAQGLDAGEVIARARSFIELSASSFGTGGLLVYTASHKTWAATLHCRPGSLREK